MRPIHHEIDRSAYGHWQADTLGADLPSSPRRTLGTRTRCHMILPIVGIVMALATGCAILGPSPEEEPAPSAAFLAQRSEQALAALRRMSEFLASRPTLRFEADIQYDAVQTSGQKIEFGSHRKYSLARPDRVRVDVAHWNGEQEMIAFDGNRLWATLSESRIYASMEYTGSTPDALDLLVNDYGLASPLSDLFRRDLADEIADRVISARELRTVTIAGVRCDHLAFRGQRVDFQLFIQQGEEPVPVRFIIDYHTEAGSPQFRARLHDWDVAPAVPDSLFRFSPAAGAQRVPFPELMDLLLGPLDTEMDEQ